MRIKGAIVVTLLIGAGALVLLGVMYLNGLLYEAVYSAWN